MSIKTVTLAATAVLTAATALAAPALAATPTPTQAACDKTPWEVKVQGTPHLVAGDPAGVYLWHNSTGFHLGVTHASSDRQVYRGTITASAPMGMNPVRLEGRDTVALSANHRVLSFTFYNFGHLDGVNFHTYCASTLTVSHLMRGTSNLGPAHVYLGAHKAHPSAVPFIVHRIPVPAA